MNTIKKICIGQRVKKQSILNIENRIILFFIFRRKLGVYDQVIVALRMLEKTLAFERILELIKC